MLAPGTRIGPYEVTDQIGVGGMGEVYRATDTNLGRHVAIKVLPDAVAMDTERLARFDREARTLAALNHPNIATIYGVERSSATTALVMELVEGPTLADRIIQGPIPIDEAIVIARQVAEALEAAHEQGIVHRDLKPANIKVRPDGTVKVLDFGLAKAVESSTVPRLDVTHSPTLSLAATQAGVLFGTAAYMSPEQAAGKAVDRRADIWSFGVVLWEMIAGKPLFGGGDSVALVLADVLRAPVDFERIPPGHVRDLLARCLDRDVKMRLRDIGEARVALAQAWRVPVLTPVIEARAPSSATRRRARFAIAGAVGSALVIAAAVAEWAPWRSEPDRPLVRLDVDLGADVALPPETYDQNVVVSPDGMRLAYVARSPAGQTRLYVRRLDQDNAVELAGTDGVVSAAFSPDSNSLAFLTGTSVKRISVQGGAALRLSDGDQSNNSLAWSDDGSILLAGIGAGLRRVPAGGGEQVKLTDLAEGEAIHAQPFPLPGGKTVLFASGTQLRNSRIEAISSSGGPRKVVVQDGTAPHYLAGGYLAYLSQGTLFAIRFDPGTLQTQGDPIPMATDVKMTYSGLAPIGTFSVSDNGTLVYRKATGPLGTPGPIAGRQSTISWIDPTGKRSPLLPKVGPYYDPRVSPDGNQIALALVDTPTPSVAAYDPRRDSLTRLAVGGSGNVNPIWSRDGRYVLFIRLGATVDYALHSMRVGAGQTQVLVGSGVRALGSFSPDGTRLAYVGRSAAKGSQPRIVIITAAVTEEKGQLKIGTPDVFSPPEFSEWDPEFSPDGKWMAFTTDRSGREEVVVRAFPIASSGATPEAVLSSNGGVHPRWAYRGRELLYLEGGRIMSVTYKVNGDVFVPDKPRVLVEKAGRQWDVAPDGRLALVEAVESQPGIAPAAEHHVVFLQHFMDEVKRRVK